MARKITRRRDLSQVSDEPILKVPAQRELDKLDREIVGLLQRRTELAHRRQAKLSPSGQDLREELVHIGQIAGTQLGPLSSASLQAIYREILSGTHTSLHPLRVAYLGPEFTYSHLAAIERFGQSADFVPVATIAAVFEEVERGQADFGLVPIENSTDGRVADALECLARSPARICGEVPLRIRHCLLANCRRDEIERVYSKRQPFSQCRNWLSQHLPEIPLVEVASSADAARKAAEEPGAAAIGSEQAGVNHGVRVLARSIQDQADNLTRFAVISTESGKKTGNDKSAIVFEINHQPGALADAMGIFKRQRLNLTWIESFPIPGQRGRYLFFVEFVGHASEVRARRALASLAKKAVRLTVLGSYAQAEAVG